MSKRLNPFRVAQQQHQQQEQQEQHDRSARGRRRPALTLKPEDPETHGQEEEEAEEKEDQEKLGAEGEREPARKKRHSPDDDHRGRGASEVGANREGESAPHIPGGGATGAGHVAPAEQQADNALAVADGRSAPAAGEQLHQPAAQSTLKALLGRAPSKRTKGKEVSGRLEKEDDSTLEDAMRIVTANSGAKAGDGTVPGKVGPASLVIGQGIVSVPRWRPRAMASAKAQQEKEEREERERNAALGLRVDEGEEGLAGAHQQGALGDSSLWLDWSMKKKLVFSSARSFAWCSEIKPAVTARGVAHGAGGVALTSLSEVATSQGLAEGKIPDSLKEQFERSLMYYTYPCIPWAPCPVDPSRDPTLAPPTYSPEALRSLHREWKEALDSLHGMIRSSTCPYFYLYCRQLTVLFRAPGVCGMKDASALIASSTKGLRTVLQKENIPFSQPLRPPKSFAAEANSSEVVHRDELAELSRQGIQTRVVDKSAHQDGKAESALLISGTMAMIALHDFLLNHKYTSAATAEKLPPPSLFAPVSFLNGQSKKLMVCNNAKVTRQRARRQGGSAGPELEEVMSVEVQGPVMPHAAYALCRIFQQAQGSFFLTTACEEASKAFNAPCDGDEGARAFAEASAGFGPDTCAHISQRPLGARETIHTYTCKGSHFSYSTKD